MFPFKKATFEKIINKINNRALKKYFHYLF